MTVIAGITDGTTTWIAADSCAPDCSGLIWPANDKLIRTTAGDSAVLLALSGSGRLKGAMRDMLTLADPGRGDLNTWARDVARRITRVALDQRPPIADPEDLASGFDGVALLGCRGGLWRLACDTAIPIPRSGAIGSGGDIAHGAMRGLDMSGHLADRELVELAVTIACTEQTDCSLPLDVEGAA